VKYKTAEEITQALREHGISAPPKLYQLEYHDPETLEPIEEAEYVTNNPSPKPDSDVDGSEGSGSS
jgi:hypothetical protein